MSILLSAESATLRAGSLAQFVTVLVIFILVLLITVFVTRWIGNYQKGRGRYGNIEIIESIRISTGVSLCIVRIGKKYAVLSVGKDSASLVTLLSEEDIDLTLGSVGTQGSFADIMKGIKDRMFDDSDKGATDLQDEQRS